MFNWPKIWNRGNQPVPGPVPVAVYTDYLCPFCFIGHLRLEKLRREYDLDVDWRFLEIHPENPPEGRPIEELGYSRRQWRRIQHNFGRMAAEEGIQSPRRTFTTNSRCALKLAQAVREHQPECFDTLNHSLYQAYFLEQRNIGDPEVLQILAKECGVEASVLVRARDNPAYDDMLADNQRSAALWGVPETPTFVFGDQAYSGAIPIHMMRSAIAKAMERTQRPEQPPRSK